MQMLRCWGLTPLCPPGLLAVDLGISSNIVGKLGGYDIETELGRGSMGVVYLAHDPCLQRQVALKTIHVPGGLDRAEIDSFRERFLREAQAAGGISHPGITFASMLR